MGIVKDEENKNLEKIYNQTVKKVTEDYETLNFNTAISQMMIFVNAVFKESVFPKYMAEGLVKLLNPIAPFMTEELWSILGHNKTIAYETWPSFDESKIAETNVEIAVSINGKLRTTVLLPIDASKEETLEKVKENEIVQKNIEGKQILKEIVVPNKIVNIVVK